MPDETRLTAASRLEKLLDNIAGGDNEVTPATRLEKFLSYIADAMEGGGSGGSCDDCVKVIEGEEFDKSDHPDATIYAYLGSAEQGEWTALDDINGVFNTEDDLPDAYVIKAIIGIAFPSGISDVQYATGETHTPDTRDPSGYYIEYADAYSLFYTDTVTILIIKNGVVNYHTGLL